MDHCVFALAVAVLSAICHADFCSIAFECENQDFGSITEHSGYFYIQGYKSHSGRLSRINAVSVYCNGASSCIEANSISAGNYIFCDGSLSCANVNDLNLKNDATGYIQADAVASMAHSTISASDKRIDCCGEQSCVHSKISQFTSLFALGAYSLLNATIEATNTHSIHLKGYYAAFGATLICNESQSLCYIYCYSNGCINFNLFCGSNQCIITGNNNAISSLPIHDLWQYDALIMTQQNDDACSLQIDSMTFDDSRERYAISTTLDNIYGGAICCRGQESCHSNTIHYISGVATSDKSIVCSGNKACRSSDIIVLDGAVYCGGDASCFLSRITATMVYCYGSSACGSSHINRTSNIYCSARESCREAFIKSDGIDLNLYLLGDTSGYKAVVKCSDSDHCSIFCSGKSACLDMTLECVGICVVHHCDEYSLCPNVFNLTGNPSTDPSLSPSELTTEPSGSPTKQPSASPTKESTTSPTKGPSASSNIDTNPPTALQATEPSGSPTKRPTAASSNTTEDASLSPNEFTTIPTKYATLSPIISDTIYEDNDAAPNVKHIAIQWIICLIILLIICCCCVACLCFKYLKKRKHKESEHINEMSNIQMKSAYEINNIVARNVDFEREMVASWLRYTVQLPQYIHLFISQGYDNMEAIQSIGGSDDLLALGIKHGMHQTLILTEIKGLQDTDFVVKGITYGADVITIDEDEQINKVRTNTLRLPTTAWISNDSDSNSDSEHDNLNIKYTTKQKQKERNPSDCMTVEGH